MKIKFACFITILFAQHSVSWAEDTKATDTLYTAGEIAHQKHCEKCHTDQVYTRDDRRVKSISALGIQVRRCRNNIGIQWFDEDTDGVIHFLNKKYYKF
jgi:hypothetical protein